MAPALDNIIDGTSCTPFAPSRVTRSGEGTIGARRSHVFGVAW